MQLPLAFITRKLQSTCMILRCYISIRRTILWRKMTIFHLWTCFKVLHQSCHFSVIWIPLKAAGFDLILPKHITDFNKTVHKEDNKMHVHIPHLAKTVLFQTKPDNPHSSSLARCSVAAGGHRYTQNPNTCKSSRRKTQSWGRN